MSNKIFRSISHQIHLFILGSAALASSLGLWIVLRFDTSALNAFGPTAFLYLQGMKNGLIVSTGLLIISFIAFLRVGTLEEFIGWLTRIWTSLSEGKKSIFILILCAVFIFATHGPNILHGYFYLDDFQIIAVNKTVPLGQSLLVEHGDHTIPLLMLEMRALNDAFGKNQIPYNIFIFVVFLLIPFFTYLVFRRMKIPTKTFLVFLLLFSGATAWAEMLTGYYSLSTITQVSLFFTILMWSYLAWLQTKRTWYLFIFGFASLCAVTIDIPGVWTLPAILLFMGMIALHNYDKTRVGRNEALLQFFKDNRLPLGIVAFVTISLSIFLVLSFFVFYPGTFLSSGGTLELSTVVRNSVSIISSGVTLSILAPNIVKILTHPALRAHVAPLWAMIEYLLLLANIVLIGFLVKYVNKKERFIILFSTVALLLTMFMVAVGRPRQDVIPDFEFKHIGMSFYFYCIVLAVIFGFLMRLRKTNMTRIVIPILIVLFSIQQAFSFQTVRLLEEAKGRTVAIKSLDSSLMGELTLIHNQNKTTLTIPNLNGTHIYEPVPGFALADYIPFLNDNISLQLIRNKAMLSDSTHTVTTVQSLRMETSDSFKESLKNSVILRSFYLAPAEMWYVATTTSENMIPLLTSSLTRKAISLQSSAVDPEEKHLLTFTLLTDDVPGNLELSISFASDFGPAENAGLIRVDDYTVGKVIGNKRSYVITTDLLQIYGYALSKEVSHITLSVPEGKNAMVTGISFK